MVVKHITGNLFDIFFGIGWENWGRFQLENNKLTQIKGKEIPKNIFLFLNKRYCK
jgi:hypothetical protein